MWMVFLKLMAAGFCLACAVVAFSFDEKAMGFAVLALAACNLEVAMLRYEHLKK